MDSLYLLRFFSYMNGYHHHVWSPEGHTLKYSVCFSIYMLNSNMILFIFFCRMRDTIVLTMRMFQSRVFLLIILYYIVSQPCMLWNPFCLGKHLSPLGLEPRTCYNPLIPFPLEPTLRDIHGIVFSLVGS